MLNSKNTTKKPKNRNHGVTKKVHKREVYESCGNVFKDMGKSDDEANNLLMRSRLMVEIEQSIKGRGWTQAKAAKVIGVAQPRIAELFADRIDLFTIDTLIKYLNKLGKEVTLTIQKKDAA